jgi:hypothetical protein
MQILLTMKGHFTISLWTLSDYSQLFRRLLTNEAVHDESVEVCTEFHEGHFEHLL